MRLLALVLAWLAGATAGQAAVVNFSFAFTNVAASGAASVVRGLILGLEDDATGMPASLQVTEAAFGLGEYVDSINANNSFFTVSGGEITSFMFDSEGSLNRPPTQTCCTLLIANALPGFPGLRSALFDSPYGGPLPATSDLAFELYTGEPTPVPLPATILMLGAAIAALGCAPWSMRSGSSPVWRRSRKTSSGPERATQNSAASADPWTQKRSKVPQRVTQRRCGASPARGPSNRDLHRPQLHRNRRVHHCRGSRPPRQDACPPRMRRTQLDCPDHVLRDIGASRADIEAELFHSYH